MKEERKGKVALNYVSKFLILKSILGPSITGAKMNVFIGHMLLLQCYICLYRTTKTKQSSIQAVCSAKNMFQTGAFL